MRAKEKKQINVEIGERIRFYREQAGYNRERFAELIGISPRFLADAETGFAGVSISNLKKICETLGVSADRLLWGTENDLGLDERISHVNPKYIPVLEGMLRMQLELISTVSNDSQS